MSKGAIGRFRTCKEHIPLWKQAELGERHPIDIEKLIWEFEMRLTLSSEEDPLLWLTGNPFSRDAIFPINMQMVFTELQNSSFYWAKHRTRVLQGSTVARIRQTKEILLGNFFFFSLFNAYTSEVFFPPIMNMNKSQGWVSLTAEHMEVVLKTSTRNIVPQHEK